MLHWYIDPMVIWMLSVEARLNLLNHNLMGIAQAVARQPGARVEARTDAGIVVPGHGPIARPPHRTVGAFGSKR